MAERTWYQQAFYRFVRGSCGLLLGTLFGLRISGRENFPAEGGGLVCANHQSYFDPVLVGVASTRSMNFLARKSLFRSFAFRWLIQMLDAIPIDRDGMGIGGLKETLKRLKRGEMVLIFPEGTRTEDGELQPLQAGFIAVARRGRAPLIPIGIDGAFQAWPKSSRIPKLRRLCVVVGEAISTEQVADWNDEELLLEMSQRIRQCFETARAARIAGKA